MQKTYQELTSLFHSGLITIFLPSSGTTTISVTKRALTTSHPATCLQAKPIGPASTEKTQKEGHKTEALATR